MRIIIEKQKAITIAQAIDAAITELCEKGFVKDNQGKEFYWKQVSANSVVKCYEDEESRTYRADSKLMHNSFLGSCWFVDFVECECHIETCSKSLLDNGFMYVAGKYSRHFGDDGCFIEVELKMEIFTVTKPMQYSKSNAEIDFAYPRTVAEFAAIINSIVIF